MDFTAIITSVERQKNDVNGNPRYRVWFDNGESFLTSPGSQYAYGIPKLNGKLVTVSTGKIHIQHIQEVNDPEPYWTGPVTGMFS
jgi:hypothetical protein